MFFVEQAFAEVRTQKSCTAGYKNSHGVSLKGIQNKGHNVERVSNISRTVISLPSYLLSSSDAVIRETHPAKLILIVDISAVENDGIFQELFYLSKIGRSKFAPLGH